MNKNIRIEPLRNVRKGRRFEMKFKEIQNVQKCSLSFFKAFFFPMRASLQ